VQEFSNDIEELANIEAECLFRATHYRHLVSRFLTNYRESSAGVTERSTFVVSKHGS